MRRSSRVFALAAGAAGVYGLLRASRRSPAGRKSQRQALPNAPRIVVLGAGFAGMTAATQIAKRLRNRARILLIDRHNYHLFTPMLYEAATCAVVPSDITFPLRQNTGRHNVEFRRGEIQGVDFQGRQVLLEGASIPYDYLVVALGSATSFFGNEEARQNSWELKQLEDAIAIRNQVVDMLEEAAITADAGKRQAMLTFVIVGGGATGVETAAAMADLLHRIVPVDYPQIDLREARVIVVEAGAKLLGHMSSRMADVALRELRKLGVEVRLHTSARCLEPDHVTLSDGSTLVARSIIWAAGVRSPEVVAKLDAEHGDHGSVVVNEYLQVPRWPDVYAVGDNAHLVDTRTGESVPLLAAAAVQEGSAVARNIARAIAGRRQFRFRYLDLGNVVELGRGSGVAEIGHVLIKGFTAWLTWRLVHLARLTSFRNKLATTVDWSIGYFYDEDTARLEVEPSYPRNRAA